MASNKKQLIDGHAKNYIRDVFAERLLDESFHNLEGRDICWYRINGEIINIISFFSNWDNLPLILKIGYGIHPLFAEPFFTKSVYLKNQPVSFEHFSTQTILENCPPKKVSYFPYSNNAQVYAPSCNGKGLFTFDGILLPLMNNIRTVEDSYLLHKQKYLNISNDNMDVKFSSISKTFIDEAIYVNDVDVFPYCRKKVEKCISIYKEYCQTNPSKKEFKDSLEHYEQQKLALFDGRREEYLTLLAYRKEKNINIMRKKYKINI